MKGQFITYLGEGRSLDSWALMDRGNVDGVQSRMDMRRHASAQRIKLVIFLINFGLLATLLQLHESVVCEGQL